MVSPISWKSSWLSALPHKLQRAVWNALRFANTTKFEEYKVKVFLLGQRVEIESFESKKFRVREQLEKFNQLSGHMLACIRASSRVRCD